MKYTTISRLTRELLTSNDSSKRRIAAERLSKADERAIYPLIKALKDDDLGVQDAAIQSLISIGGEVTAYMVIPLLREDSQLRNTAILILQEIGPEALPLLRVLLSDKDDDVRKFAIDIIGKIGKWDYPEILVEMLKKDPNPNVRASAAKTIGILNYREALSDLWNALYDEEWVCFSALEALGLIKDELSIPYISKLLESDSLTVRCAAIETLGILGYKSGADPLIKRFFSSDSFEKGIIIKSLVLLENVPSLGDIYDYLIAMLNSDDLKEKEIGLKGLKLLGDKKAIPVIIDIAGSLDPSNPEVEDFLIYTKKILYDFGCYEELIKVIEDPSTKYRGKVIAIEVIGDLKCKKAVPVLIRLIHTDMRDVRRASMVAMAQINDTENTSFFIDAISSEDGHIRRTALSALGRIADKNTFDPIFELLKKEVYEDVIEEAIRALLKINRDKYIAMQTHLSSRIKEITNNVLIYG
jgi:HEAT repeat protein